MKEVWLAIATLARPYPRHRHPEPFFAHLLVFHSLQDPLTPGLRLSLRCRDFHSTALEMKRWGLRSTMGRGSRLALSTLLSRCRLLSRAQWSYSLGPSRMLKRLLVTRCRTVNRMPRSKNLLLGLTIFPHMIAPRRTDVWTQALAPHAWLHVS